MQNIAFKISDAKHSQCKIHATFYNEDKGELFFGVRV